MSIISERIPELLINRLQEQYSEENVKDIFSGYTANRKVSLRINRLKASKQEIIEILECNNIKYSELSWYDDALIINNQTEAELEKLDIYKEGKIYLQSLSSMLPPIILDANENEDILDMCAAPGGKTTQIAALTNNKAGITACEMNKIRAEKLRYNIQKQGATQVNIMEIDSRKLDELFSFNKILADVPCSGSGTIHIDDYTNVRFTEVFEQKLERTQTEILEKAISLLKKGSEMVYSTCSILNKENEYIVQKFIDKKLIEVIPIENRLIAEIPQLPCEIKGAMCVMPNELFEGFFVVKVKKI